MNATEAERVRATIAATVHGLPIEAFLMALSVLLLQADLDPETRLYTARIALEEYGRTDGGLKQ